MCQRVGWGEECVEGGGGRVEECVRWWDGGEECVRGWGGR